MGGLLYIGVTEGAVPMKKPRRNHSPAFKARMALEVLRCEKTLAQLSALHEVHVTQLTSWKNELLEGAPGIFGG